MNNIVGYVFWIDKPLINIHSAPSSPQVVIITSDRVLSAASTTNSEDLSSRCILSPKTLIKTGLRKYSLNKATHGLARKHLLVDSGRMYAQKQFHVGIPPAPIPIGNFWSAILEQKFPHLYQYYIPTTLAQCLFLILLGDRFLEI